MIHRHFSTLLFLIQLIYEVEWKCMLQLLKLKTVPAKLGGWGLVVGRFCPTFPTFCSLRLLNDTCDEWKNLEPCCRLLACTLVAWTLFWERCIVRSCCWTCRRTSISRPSHTVVELSGRITPSKLKSSQSIWLKKHSGSSPRVSCWSLMLKLHSGSSPMSKLHSGSSLRVPCSSPLSKLHSGSSPRVSC